MEIKEVNIGDRVGVILKTDNKKHNCYFLGYGIYEGKEVPPIDKTNKKTLKITKLDNEHCKFVLDSGEIFYDYFCWFMSEERFNEVFVNDCYNEGWKVINVNKYGRRRKNNGTVTENNNL